MCVLVSGCAKCGCEISTSSTDRAEREARMREIEAYNRPFESYSFDEAVARGRAEYQRYEKRYDARFLGRITPGMGCEACPWACERWDLSPMDADRYKARFREATRLEKHGKTREERYIGGRENRRLMCVVATHRGPMLEALLELMHPRESPAVRYEALSIAVLWGFETTYTKAMLENLASGKNENYAELARDKLGEIWDAGVSDAIVD